jgi:glycosyltransferase involved in cell wall biosynthesis
MAGGVDTIIAVSDETAGFVKKAYPYNAHKVRTVVNGIDIPENPGWDKEKLEAEFKIPRDAQVIVNVASLTPVKDHALLIRAFAHLKKDNAKATLLLVGDGPLRGDLEELSREVGCRDSIVFAGERIDGPEIIAACDVFCISSSAEGTSIAVLETMARGCPMVLTAVGGNVDLVQDGIDGILVPHGDPVVLAGAIKTILNDRGLAMGLAEAALGKLRSDYSAIDMTRRTEAVYGETISAMLSKQETL